MRTWVLVGLLGTTAYADDKQPDRKPDLKEEEPPRAEVTLGKPTIASEADATTITRYVAGQQSRIAACYTEPGDASLTVKFEVGIDGKVKKATVTGASEPIAKCIAGVFEAIAFPKPKDKPVSVSYPIAIKDLIGHGGGFGYGAPANPRPGRPPVMTIGQPTISGGDLDKAIIRRYIKRNAQKLQYCYEKVRIAKPKLAGSVTVKFEIDGEGKVPPSTASATGLGSEVPACITNVIKQIEFPKPKDGKKLKVSYPFTFKPDGT